MLGEKSSEHESIIGAMRDRGRKGSEHSQSVEFQWDYSDPSHWSVVPQEVEKDD